MRRYRIITFGCQMNKSDSERIVAVFEHKNCSATDSIENADYVVINACSVRQKAIDRIWGLIKNFNKIKRQKNLVTILTGCLLSGDRKKFKNKFDFIFNIKEINKFKKFLREKSSRSDENYFNILPKTASPFFAYIPIMTGCNNFCSYCVVPFARGGEVSRTIKDILNEIKKIAHDGCKAVELLGQNVNSYSPADKDNFSKDNPFKHNFAKLLWEVNQIKGLNRVNFSSSHPKDINDDVLNALSLSKQVNYLHLALQSGDNQVLRRMNRKYTVEKFEKIINKARRIKSDIAIGTDIIVGFPGETKAQFENTLKFYEKTRFDIAFISKYSSREGTAAAKLANDIPALEKKRRWRELQALMEKIVLEKNQKYVGHKVEVLIDYVQKDYCEGNSREMKRVRIYNNRRKLKLGDFVNVKIKEAKEWILIG